MADLQGDRREVQHRRVVERRAAQVHVAVERLEPEDAEEPARRQRRLVGVLAGQRAAYALGAAGGARGVDHGGARSARVRAARALGAEGGQRGEAGDLPHREPGVLLDPGGLGCLGGDGGEPLVGHERRGAAVGQDVGHLGGGQVPVHRDHVQAGLDGGEEQGEGFGAVRQHPGHAVAGPQSERLQPPAVLVGPRGQVGVADGAAVRFDHREAVRGTRGDVPQADVGHLVNLEHVLLTDKVGGPRACLLTRTRSIVVG